MPKRGLGFVWVWAGVTLGVIILSLLLVLFIASTGKEGSEAPDVGAWIDLTTDHSCSPTFTGLFPRVYRPVHLCRID